MNGDNPERGPRHETKHGPKPTLAIAALVLLAGCLDDTIGDPDRGLCHKDSGGEATLWASGAEATEPGRWLAVVGTDYQTSEISVVDLKELKTRAPAFLHSGTRVTCMGAALSGDVVLGRQAAKDGTFVLIDRSNAVLTRVGPRGVLGQLAVGGGFFANPQDALSIDSDALLVTRAQGAPVDPNREDAQAEGQDLLAIDKESGQRLWRAPLASQSTLSGGHAWPGKMTTSGGLVWIPLASVARDFSKMGPGRIVTIDPKDGALRRVIDLPDAKNCTAIAPAGLKAVAAVCSGFFKDGPLDRATFSRVIRISTQGPTGAIKVLARASDTINKQPFGFDLAMLDASRGWVIADGDLEAGMPDALWEFDADAETLVRVAQGSGAFTMTSLFLDHARQHLWVTDRGAEGGDLRIFDVSGQGTARPLAQLDSNPGGLRATEIVGF